jgi:NADH-quinone oxidoreductase subunit J
MAEVLFFYLFGALLLVAALMVVFSRQPIYSVLSLLIAMFCLAALFVMLGAYFVAALQILLYAGAVLVLFLLVIMLLNLERETLARMRPFTLRGIGMLVAILFCVQLIQLFARSPITLPATTVARVGTVEQIGKLLFTTYLLPFELTSFLILAAIIGAVTLARSAEKQP